MIPKTRDDAIEGKREKPHYFLAEKGRLFLPAGYFDGDDLEDIAEFEARIDWSTWGRE